MIILALLLLLAIVCAYSWVAYRIKTSNPVKPTVPASVKLTPFRMGDYLDTPEAVAEYARQEAEQSGKSG